MSDVFTLDSRPPNSTLQVTIVQIGIQNHDFYTFFALFSYDLSLSALREVKIGKIFEIVT